VYPAHQENTEHQPASGEEQDRPLACVQTSFHVGAGCGAHVIEFGTSRLCRTNSERLVRGSPLAVAVAHGAAATAIAIAITITITVMFLLASLIGRRGGAGADDHELQPSREGKASAQRSSGSERLSTLPRAPGPRVLRRSRRRAQIGRRRQVVGLLRTRLIRRLR